LTNDQVKQSIRELEELGSQMRKWRTVTLLVVLVVSVLFGTTLTRAVQALKNPGPAHDVFMSRLQSGMQEQVLPEAKNLASNAAAEVAPLVMAEIQNIKLQGPLYAEALKHELDTLKANMPKRAETILNQTVGETVRAREAKVRAMYPDLTEEKVSQLVDNLVSEAEVRLVKVVDETTKPHQDSLENIIALLDEIHTLEADNVKEEKPTLEMALVFLDLFQVELGQPASTETNDGGAK
jgi:hypothetical protein